MKRLTGSIFIAILLGGIVGYYFPEQARDFGFLGKLFIQMITIIAGPFLFSVIVHSIVAHAVPFRDILRLLAASFTNSILAIAIALGLVNYFKPGVSLPYKAPVSTSQLLDNLTAKNGFSLESFLKTMIPESIMQPFTSQNMLSLIFLAVVIGAALRSTKHKTAAIIDLTNAAQHLFEKILIWFSRLVPIGVFAAIARTIADHGVEALAGLLQYALAVTAALLLQVIITYHSWIRFYCRMSLKSFWTFAYTPVVYSLGVNSSLATLPLTLEALKKMKVSEEASTLGACIGTNLNNDGILLYQVAAAVMVSQSLGINLSLPDQLVLAGISIIASIGMAGIPEAGFILLTIVFTTMGLPIEGIPILLTVDWLLGRLRSAVNVLNDMVISMVIDRHHKGSAPFLL